MSQQCNQIIAGGLSWKLKPRLGINVLTLNLLWTCIGWNVQLTELTTKKFHHTQYPATHFVCGRIERLRHGWYPSLDIAYKVMGNFEHTLNHVWSNLKTY